MTKDKKATLGKAMSFQNECFPLSDSLGSKFKKKLELLKLLNLIFQSIFKSKIVNAIFIQ